MIDPATKDVNEPGGRGPGEISNLRVEFVLPDAGAFGRDKKVALREATHAHVTYLRDRAAFDETLPVSQAMALINQARADATMDAHRTAAAAQQRTDEAADVERRLAALACAVCGGKSFDEKIGREDSQWGYTTLRMKLVICKRCGYVMHFALGTSMFVPGS